MELARTLLFVITAITFGAILFLVFLLIKQKDDNKMVEKNKVKEELGKTFLGLIFIAAIIAYLPFIVFANFYENSHTKKVLDTQMENCLSTTTKNDRELTAKQCNYFTSVVNGLYTDEGVDLTNTNLIEFKP